MTGGLRWTEDKKRFIDIPSEVITQGYGYPITGVVNQQWDQLTGRAAVNWTPKLDFTDQTLVYGSFAHGYKAGGANPPGAVFQKYNAANIPEPIHPLTFKPEFINAYELGSKNTLLDGALTLNGDVFLLRLQGISDFRNRGPHVNQSELQRHGERRRTRNELGTGAGPEVLLRRRI